ncbi:MAG: hypothetical protein KA479_06510 [Saprospiraceae bacterium]|nr:hypothetical protein [Saprospiraceae bacterium]
MEKNFNGKDDVSFSLYLLLILVNQLAMKMIVLLFILGFVLTMLGAFAKLEGWSYFGEMLMAGIGLSGLGVVLVLWKVVTQGKTNAV